MRVIVWILSFLSNILIEDYDKSIQLVFFTQPGSHIPNSFIGKLFSSLARWDSVFFLQIAHEGYLYEKNHAFFPLYPLTIRLLSFFLSPLGCFLTQDEIFIISAVMIS